MKVGIITFHAAHNYGSMLQAYALQQTVISLGHKCEIINFRTPRQKYSYQPFYRFPNIKAKIKTLLLPKLAFNDRKKHLLFENFLSEKLILSSNEYATNEELRNAGFDFDAYISGSDQIWNIHCFDYDTAYFLDFVKYGKKIAYAPSMGPIPLVETQTLERDKNSIATYLNSYSSVSVREEATSERIKLITGRKYPIALDPTLLFTAQQWEALIKSSPLAKGQYILIYSPWHDTDLYQKAAQLSNLMGLNVIVTIAAQRHRWILNNHFKFITTVGPIEFLNLVKNATLVVSGSFHAAVFSLLLGTQLYAVNGMDDARVSQLLSMTGLERFAEYPEKLLPIEELTEIYSHGLTRLEPHIAESLAFLRNALSTDHRIPDLTDSI